MSCRPASKAVTGLVIVLGLLLSAPVALAADRTKPTGPTSVTVLGLAPSTQYDFAIRAQDLGYNLSPPSGAVSATTAASTDAQAPTAPGNLVVWDQFCGEVLLMWNQSTDHQRTTA